MGGRAGGVSPAGGSAVGDAGASSAFFKMEKNERRLEEEGEETSIHQQMFVIIYILIAILFSLSSLYRLINSFSSIHPKTTA